MALLFCPPGWWSLSNDHASTLPCELWINCTTTSWRETTWKWLIDLHIERMDLLGKFPRRGGICTDHGSLQFFNYETLGENPNNSSWENRSGSSAWNDEPSSHPSIKTFSFFLRSWWQLYNYPMRNIMMTRLRTQYSTKDNIWWLTISCQTSQKALLIHFLSSSKWARKLSGSPGSLVAWRSEQFVQA